MTRILDRLEAKGLCKRIRSSDDRRVVNLELTTKGEDALSGAQLTLAEVIDSHLAGFSREERQVLHGNLQRMLENGVALRDVGGDLPEQ